MKKRFPAAILCLLLAAGCAAQPGAPAPGVPPLAQKRAERTPRPDPEEPSKSESAASEAPPAPETLFAAMPKNYLFCSGAGAWSTELTVEEDGTFSGYYHDSEMGDAGPDYPQGTRYICAFSGKFTRPEQLDATTWSTSIETLDLEHPADESEEILDGVRCIYTGPYGLEDAEELRIYLPDTPVDGLPEGALWAVRGPYDFRATEDGTLGLCVIYNVAGDQGFVEYPLDAE